MRARIKRSIIVQRPISGAGVVPSSLVIKLWPKRWQRRRPLSRGVVRPKRGIFPVVVAAPAALVFKALRRLKLKRRAVKPAARRYPAMAAPAGFVAFKKPPRAKVRRGRRFIRFPRLYSIAGPPASFLPTKHSFRIRIKRARRFIRFPRLYSIAGPPARFAPAKRSFRIRIRRARRFVKIPRLYSIAGAPASFLPTKRAFKARIRRARRFIRLPRLYSIAGPPAGFAAFKPRSRLRLHSRPWARFFRPKGRGIFPVIVVIPAALVFKALRRLKLRRRAIKSAARRYPVMGAPASFVPFGSPRVLQLHSQPLKVFFRPRRRAAILAAAAVLFRKLPRLRLKRRVVRLWPRRYPVMAAPAGFVAFKKPPRAKVKRWRSSLRPFAKRLYSIAGLPAGFIGALPARVLQLNSRPLKVFFRPRKLRRFYAFIGAAPIVSAIHEFIIKWRRRGRR